MDTLEKLYLSKLSKVWSIESQLVEALPEMEVEATREELKEAIRDHLEETKTQVARIEEICRAYDFNPKQISNLPFTALLEETADELSKVTGETLKDAFIIASAQTVEHLEMAKYGTLIEWAKELEDETAQRLLKASLAEEEAADKKLSSIAKGGLFSEGVNEASPKA